MSENEVSGEVIEVKETEINGIKISEEVVAQIAGKAASEVSGVAGMSGGIVGGLSEMLGGKKNFSKGVKVQVGEKETTIDLFIIVEYGARIPDIAWEIQNKVKTVVENMTGLKVVDINIHVQGLNIAKEEKKDTSVESGEQAESKE
ncbi:MAG: Asp23/Gls24 family envelope stress response protein [Clostridia bacterium]|nr:Asp23/Gls24 family envelope stress response protein [Clostridia bacterium]